MNNYNETILEMLNTGKTPEAIYEDSLRVLAEEPSLKARTSKALREAIINYINAWHPTRKPEDIDDFADYMIDTLEENLPFEDEVRK